MKKDKNWLKETLKKRMDYWELNVAGGDYGRGRSDETRELLKAIDQLEEPEQEKAVVPQFVADFITEIKPNFNIRAVFTLENDKHEQGQEWALDNPDVFARAWLDGFLIDGNEEEWKPIEGFHNEVSNLGRVKSVGHKAGNEKFYKGKILKPIVTESGYVNVSLVSKDGGKVIKRVHRLVAENFIDNKEGKPEVNHIDGDKENNSVVNLEWVTSSENTIHAYKEGLHIPLKGSEKYFAKLTECDVVDIRKEYREGCVQAEIAEKYGVARQTISSIVNNKAWKHVIDDFAEEVTK